MTRSSIPLWASAPSGSSIQKRVRSRKRSCLPAAGVEPLELPDGPLGDRAAAVRGLVERGGAEDHGMAVARQSHPQCEGVGPLVQRGLEGGDRVLGRLGRGAPARDDERPSGWLLHCLYLDLRGTLGPCALPSWTPSVPSSGSGPGSTGGSASRASRTFRRKGR